MNDPIHEVEAKADREAFATLDCQLEYVPPTGPVFEWEWPDYQAGADGVVSVAADHAVRYPAQPRVTLAQQEILARRASERVPDAEAD